MLQGVQRKKQTITETFFNIETLTFILLELF